MRILLTGGAGFIGFHAAKILLARGDKIIIVDNFNDYYDPAIKEDRIKELEKEFDNLQVIRADITDYDSLEKIFKKNKFDKICHLAAQAGVRYSLENPFIYEKSNYLGTLNLLELCRHYQVNDFVFASSSSVYGDNKKLPFAEIDRTDSPISLYAATKKADEELAFTYHHLYGLNCTGLRFFTAYGPWGRPDMALFKFTKNIIDDKKIDVNNFGEMSRDFTYISDIVTGLVAAIDKPFAYEIFNLAKGETVKLNDFISAIENKLGKEAKKNMLPIPAGDVPATWADISKAKEMLNYTPQISVEEGISNFIDWYQGYYK